MAKQTINNAKLGTFVLAGLFFLVLLLYMIGKNRNMFGDTYVLVARFENIQGLVTGNNVRFAGIEAGTVKKINIYSDTVIEVTMVIEKKMQAIIRKNAIVSIGTEGLVGNKVVNILPAGLPAPLAKEGDTLLSKKAVSTDEMLQTLYKTNNDIAFVAAELKTTVQRVNNSSALWDLLNEKSIPKDIRMSVANIRQATLKAGKVVNSLDAMVSDVKSGKGSVGVLLTDSSFAKNLNEAATKIKSVGEQADKLINEISSVMAGINTDINQGKGPANALLKDSLLTEKLNATLENIRQGTDGFNQNMEALKHNFLFKGYFKKLERQKKQEAAKASAKQN